MHADRSMTKLVLALTRPRWALALFTAPLTRFSRSVRLEADAVP
jgi:hypothetical protein